MPVSRYTKRVFGGLIFFYLLCALFRFLDFRFPEIPFRFSAFAVVGFSAIIISFLFYVQKDLPLKYSRAYFMAMLFLLLLWQILDVFLILLPPVSGTLTRLLWYLVYVPTLFVPTCFLLAVAHYEISQYRVLPAPWILVHITSGFFVFLVLTNDYHRLAFDYGDPANAAYVHSYGPVYYLLMVWVFLQLIAAILMIERRARIDQIGGSRLYLFVAALILFVYAAWYALGSPFFPQFNKVIFIQDFALAAAILPLEIALRKGHLRSNFNYMEVLEASMLSLSIEDDFGDIYFQTAQGIPISEDDRKRARGGSHYLDMNHLLHSRQIKGGRAFWVEDMTPINKITASLRDLQTDLAEQNEIIKAENEMIARSAKADEQNRLYSMLMRMANPQLQKLQDMLSEMRPEDPSFREMLAEACVYKVYVKRFSNLALLAQESEEMDLFELRSSLLESSDYLRLNGINTAVKVTGGGKYPSSLIIYMYSLFQQITEGVLHDLTSVTTHINGQPDILNIEFSYVLKDDPDEGAVTKLLARQNGRMVISGVYVGTIIAEREGSRLHLRIQTKREEEDRDDDE